MNVTQLRIISGALSRQAWFWGPLIVWLPIAMCVVWCARDSVNPDAVAYVMNGRHYLAGRFALAVNGWFGPAYSWLAAAGVLLGVEPMLFLRASGLVFAPLTAWAATLLALRTSPSRWGCVVFASVLALCLRVLGDEITPDLMLACGLAWHLVLSARFLEKPTTGRAVATALAGGACYMIKSYALPFVAAFMAATMAWVFFSKGGSRPRARTVAAAVAAFLFSTAPWATVVSLQAGRPCISTLAGSYDAWRPPFPPAPLPVYDLQIPDEGRMTVWENPARISRPWPVVSPSLWSGRLDRGLQVAGLNAVNALHGLRRIDWIGALLVLSLLPLLPCGLLAKAGWVMDEQSQQRRRIAIWLLLGSAIYLGGLMFLWVYDRFMISLYAPLIASAAWSVGHHRRRAARWLLGCVLVLCPMLRQGAHFALSPDVQRNWEKGSAIRRLAGEVPNGCFLASNDWHVGLCAAYWSRGRFLGSPSDSGAELEDYPQCVMLMIGDDRKPAEALVANRCVYWRLDDP
ncbi:MAG: hypothetical protein GXY38_02020 [Planctomycetes bacterium]|nr:hypothetical protein [Planctomycetota bacterium]